MDYHIIPIYIYTYCYIFSPIFSAHSSYCETFNFLAVYKAKVHTPFI